MFRENWVVLRACLRALELVLVCGYCAPSLNLVLVALNVLGGRGSMRPQIATVSLVVVVLLGPRHSRWPTPCDLSVTARVDRTFVCLLLLLLFLLLFLFSCCRLRDFNMCICVIAPMICFLIYLLDCGYWASLKGLL